ncbi:MAG: hypothetical protein HDR11_06830 [Lachnospiraceae bacterium]|nr:hypothetical protein [Lachnospiraceae bacterium]
MSNLTETAGKEILRNEILEICRETAPDGAGIPLLKACLHKAGIETDERELERQAAYLQDKGLAAVDEIKNVRLGIRRRIVRITAAGMDFLEGNREEAGITG